MSYYNPYFGNQASNGGLIEKNNYRYMSYTFNQLVTYNRTFNEKHEISALLGHEYYDYEQNYLTGSRSGLVSGIYEVIGASINDTRSQTDRHTIESYFARLNYGFDNKYYIDGSWRTDGSSRFAPDHRWGHFWSVGASWRISQEEFMRDIHWINNLTLKASYGVQGNENIDTYYGWQGYYSITSTGTDYGFSIAQLENPELTWEKNGNFNVGIEATLLGNRLNATIEYYNRKTTDMIMERPMAFSTGFESYLDNIGEMRNTGWEISLNGVLVNRPDFRWDVTVMASTQNNEVLKLTPEAKEIIGGSTIVREGLPVNTFYLPKFAGVDPATGAALYWAYDTDDKGNITNEYVTSTRARPRAAAT